MSADSDKDLTILLTLWDRAAYTMRWMRYATWRDFRFKIIIADGGSGEEIPALLSDRPRFPRLDYEYVRYPYDRNYVDYLTKVLDALSRVQTPFVVLADNDDFFNPGGLREALRFLREHPNYNTCGGQYTYFSVEAAVTESGAVAKERVTGYKHRHDGRSDEEETASERLLKHAQVPREILLYNIRRPEELRIHYEAARRADIKNLFLLETFVQFQTVINGKSKRLDQFYLAKQLNSPQSSWDSYVRSNGEAFDQMLGPTWSDDFTKFQDVVSTALAKIDNVPMHNARELVHKAYRSWAAPEVLSAVLNERSVSFSMPFLLQMTKSLLRLPRTSRIRKAVSKVYRRQPWFDANRGAEMSLSGDGSREELGRIEEFLATKAS